MKERNFLKYLSPSSSPKIGKVALLGAGLRNLRANRTRENSFPKYLYRIIKSSNGGTPSTLPKPLLTRVP